MATCLAAPYAAQLEMGLRFRRCNPGQVSLLVSVKTTSKNKSKKKTKNQQSEATSEHVKHSQNASAPRM